MKTLDYKNIVSIFIFILLSTSWVAAQKTYTTKDNTTNLNQYQTYEWVFNKEMIPENQVLVDGNLMLVYNNMTANKAVKDAIETQMEANGFTRTSENPDMLVNFRVFEKPTELRTFRDNERSYLGFGPSTTSSTMVPVKAGTILVDFIDAETGVNIWQGFASGAFDVADMKNVSNLEAKVIAIFNEWDFDPFAE